MIIIFDRLTTMMEIMIRWSTKKNLKHAHRLCRFIFLALLAIGIPCKKRRRILVLWEAKRNLCLPQFQDWFIISIVMMSWNRRCDPKSCIRNNVPRVLQLFNTENCCYAAHVREYLSSILRAFSVNTFFLLSFRLIGATHSHKMCTFTALFANVCVIVHLFDCSTRNFTWDVTSSSCHRLLRWKNNTFVIVFQLSANAFEKFIWKMWSRYYTIFEMVKQNIVILLL